MVDRETMLSAVLVWMERQPEHERLAAIGTLATVVLGSSSPDKQAIWFGQLERSLMRLSEPRPEYVN